MSTCEVLRIGHRPERDKRITTHVALTARAFGACKISLSKPDSRIIDTVDKVTENFGGDFIIETTTNPKAIVKNWAGTTIHLTMFGLPIDDNLEDIKKCKGPLLFVVGAEKVPPWVFEHSDFNIAIGSQPHSEVSALAIALSKINDVSYSQNFEGQLQVVPSGERRQMENSREVDS